MKTETSHISFADGRQGSQVVLIHDDGERELVEIVVTRNDLGQPCQHVYSRRADYAASVFSLTDLGNGSKWEIVPGSIVTA